VFTYNRVNIIAQIIFLMIKCFLSIFLFLLSLSIFGQNLITNPSCELDPTSNGWTQVSGNWVRGQESVKSGATNPQAASDGSYHFFAGAATNTVELYQDVDVSSNATDIDAGVYKFTFSSWMRDWSGNDEAQVIVEYRNASSTVLATYSTGFCSETSWTQFTDIRTAPTNTRTIRIRLQSKLNSGTDNDGYIDNLSLIGQKDIGIYGPGGIGKVDGTSSLVLWLDANTVSATNGSTVTSWNDESGNNYNLTAGNGATYNTNVQNGYPAFNFDGSTDYFERAYEADLNPSALTIFTADNVTSSSNYKAILSNRDDPAGTEASGFILYATPTDNYWQFWNGSVANSWEITNSGTSTAGSWAGQTSEYQSGTDGKKIYVNGEQKAQNTHTLNNNTSNPIRVGAGKNESATPDYYYQGYIGEIIMYDVVINDAQRIIIQNYLAAKYNYSLTTYDIYSQDDSGNGNYDHEVAGIGRVDDSNYHNDAQGTGIVRILNPTNLDDDEFLIWGHDNGTQTLNSTTDIPSSVRARFEREWRVSEVNVSGTAVDVGSVDIRWDLTGQSNIVTADLRLLIDTDNDGSFANETPISGATSLGGNIYAFTGVTAITDGRRFTLASTNKANVSTDPTYFEYISNVQIGSINNTTTGSDADGDGNNAYDDFTDQTAVLLPSSTYSLSVTIHADVNDYIKAWIDWNDDGDFIDAGEEFTLVSNTSSDGPHSASITVPSSASGNNVKMRVSLKYSSAPTSTESVTYGEVEEYSIYIDKDTDGDGVYDSNDKDADNDGMLDEDENYCLSQEFLNGNFESGPFPSTYVITDASNVEGWNTTASDNKIEIWHDGFHSVPAYEGTYFAEICANNVFPQRLYQTLNVDPGDIVKWNVAHRGRAGVDTMAIRVGPTGSPTTQQIAATDKTSWKVYSSSYTVPAGVTQIEMGFESISTAGSNNSVGNFIDDVQLYITKTTYCDSDGDGTPNIYDLDSDNDGIADVIEAGGTDPDNDGRIGTGAITDTDGDGLSDIVDTDNGGTPLTEPNSDSDPLKNYMDIDSDHDGIVDNIEGQTTASYTAPSGTDANNNGWDDAYDGSAGGTAIVLTDTDGDGTPDYIDTNSDDDGEPDSVEAYDTDKSGTTNTPPTNGDADGDGLDNAYDVDGTSSTDNGGPTNNGQTASSFPNDDNSTSSERDWRDILSTLPVSLISFEAELKGDYVELKWVTASEINNDYFIVQRSLDNKTFEEITRVSGNGNSNIIIEYQSYDMDLPTGIIYYRLKQVDYDGTIDYSNVVAIRNYKDKEVQIFPNPSNGIINIETKETLSIIIYSISGQQIASFNFEANTNNQIDISNQPKGVYFLTYISNDKSIIKKLIVR